MESAGRLKKVLIPDVQRGGASEKSSAEQVLWIPVLLLCAENQALRKIKDATVPCERRKAGTLKTAAPQIHFDP
ncbi:hypothetical protein C6I21_07865 [Alkalicoccus urumqiensis]|uniref:Uncharacterized protein n=1 Tax=Alkalicoccus urumqiensis TaxID=1548213 RepID=A0A2P6MHM6_ALKUR|nr:hypothetical protein C6I21_07865 [Alkalicoccus urumqiensis]